VALGAEAVNLVELKFLDDADQVGVVDEVSVMEMKPHIFLVGVLVEVVYPVRVKGACPFILDIQGHPIRTS
jgi:hypothetical protein